MPQRTTASLEPLFFSETIPQRLSDLALELQREANDFDRELPSSPHIRKQLRDMIRMMNCYYSNCIEGHHTRPADIENALRNERLHPTDHLLEEALAHIQVQEHIDRLALEKQLPVPVSLDFIKDLHKRFYEGASPPRMSMQRPNGSSVPIRPGCFRSEPEENVIVGWHHPPVSPSVDDFMTYFSEHYQRIMMNSTARIVGIAAAHHRFNHIHPFVDGNGRVSRLIAHAMFRHAGLGVDGLWSISRGLARGLKGRPGSEEYKSYMARADRLRDGDYDGRGTLSCKALEEFCQWFLEVALDQIRFMRTRFEAQTLQTRYQNLIRDHYGTADSKHASRIIECLFKQGEILKKDLPGWLGCTDKTARTRIKPLLDDGFVKEDPNNKRTPYQLGLPVEYASRLFPGIF